MFGITVGSIQDSKCSFPTNFIETSVQTEGAGGGRMRKDEPREAGCKFTSAISNWPNPWGGGAHRWPPSSSLFYRLLENSILWEFIAHRANSKVGSTGSNQLRWVCSARAMFSKEKCYMLGQHTVQEVSCKTTKLWHFLENEETWQQESINFIRPWLPIWETAVSLRWGMCPPSS